VHYLTLLTKAFASGRLENLDEQTIHIFFSIMGHVIAYDFAKKIIV
jgi:hypothetical protein